jgi:hypothetical protein
MNPFFDFTFVMYTGDKLPTMFFLTHTYEKKVRKINNIETAFETKLVLKRLGALLACRAAAVGHRRALQVRRRHESGLGANPVRAVRRRPGLRLARVADDAAAVLVVVGGLAV